MEELRCRIYEIEDLRDEKEHQSLAEMSHNAYHGEDHASEIAICVSDENFSWIPIMLENGQGYTKEW